VIGIFTESGKFYSVPDLPYVYMHNGGCGGPAFVSSYLPVTGEELSAEGIVHINGMRAVPEDIAVCGTCGGLLYTETNPPDLDNFRRTNGGFT
jgi:hypothetical protein